MQYILFYLTHCIYIDFIYLEQTRLRPLFLLFQQITEPYLSPNCSGLMTMLRNLRHSLVNITSLWRTSSGWCCCDASAWIASTAPSLSTSPRWWERSTWRRPSSVSRPYLSRVLRCRPSCLFWAPDRILLVTSWSWPNAQGLELTNSSSYPWVKVRKRWVLESFIL